MAKEIRIPVPEGLVAHGVVTHEVILKEPTYEDYLDLGEITTLGKAPDGTLFSVQNSEVLRSYIAKCLVHPKDPIILGQGGLKLARAIKGAVQGFFQDEPSKDEPSPTSPTTSSSDVEKDGSAPTTSAG
ncbi:hypothetical protein LGH83_04600 [Lichenihabitans sp. PAMC28606]|uniref:hypothetical protein n=1 Tax=Lichenihabitans sp. PAMC28606 TaxID=2880932 RepID=UPI001D0A5E4A|nr:hypothetical protein [Lichenihabitans sp. PAMC28606]UDL95507.1 hypothetical protein LGH83_04600 [Lichenihabitans sp. PAMC28606]